MFFRIKTKAWQSMIATTVLYVAALQFTTVQPMVNFGSAAALIALIALSLDGAFNFAIYWMNRKNRAFLKKADDAVISLCHKTSPFAMTLALPACALSRTRVRWCRTMIAHGLFDSLTMAYMRYVYRSTD